MILNTAGWPRITAPAIFISATEKENVDEFKTVV
jgi:hypothetical protein